MSGIRVYQIHKIHELFTVLHCLSNLPKSDSSKKLVIVDSLSALCAIVPNTDLTPILSNLASVCRFLVNNSRVVVVIVNTVRLQKGGDNLFTESDITANAKLKPSLGNYWLGVPNVRLLITQLENKRREISVWSSDPMADGKKCFVAIKDEGILSS
ncbi:hypothetical protein TSAR_008736 [Trichomalopsis sarcophagae]|uniref:Uncharacterized protein n=1 Tax=Trichomalopsis sarcophagae TaxID=543379 RepID=A0A232F740_9HYME|nr:hypothetical protein TSAR_008736 [Trichomalopsis sarcophagae]